MAGRPESLRSVVSKNMLFADVVEVSRRIASTTKRLEKTDLLANLLRQLSPEEVEVTVAFLSGSTRQGRIGVGYATISEAKRTPASAATVQIMEVDRELADLAKIRGAGSDGRRRELLTKMMERSTENEQQFLKALLVGELRQGALEGIMLEALAKASGTATERVRRAAMLAGGPTTIARPLLELGESGLAQFDIQLFRPVQPMLAQTAEDVADALKELGESALEYKFDGARVQVHKSGDQVAIFSRSMNDVGAAVPEVVDAVRSLPAHDLILDGEVLSLDPEGRARPFQVSMRRFGRRLDVENLRAELPMTPFWFDLLYLNGSPVLNESQEQRFAELTRLVPPANLVSHLKTGDPDRCRGVFAPGAPAGK